MIRYGIGLFGEWLAESLDNYDLTVVELSEKIGITREEISCHLHKRRKPYRSTLHKYSEYL